MPRYYSPMATSSQVVDPVLDQSAAAYNSHLYFPGRLFERPSHTFLTCDYVENEATLSQSARSFAAAIQVGGLILPIREYPKSNSSSSSAKQGRQVVSAYFDAIRHKHDDVIALLLDNNLVSTETLHHDGRTPLLVAVESGHIRTVQQLMDYNADVNAYGTIARSYRYTRRGEESWLERSLRQVETRRTPLQLAAELGNLLLVKLLVETYQADDSLIAPDGELALTLAVKNGHRDVVVYLPLRRGGSWQRWKTKNRWAIIRTIQACQRLNWFLKCLLYHIPKFFIWNLPKDFIFTPIIKAVKWLNVHYKELPARIWSGLRDHVWPAIKAFGNRLYRFTMKIPTRLRILVKWLWRSVLSIPQAAKIIALWFWNGVITLPQVTTFIIDRLFSWLHTTAVAIATFFKNATLKDILNGFLSLIRSTWEFPKTLLRWAQRFEDTLYKAIETLLGAKNSLMPILLVYFMLYVPKKVLVIIINIGEVMGNGISELVIGCINPKWQLGV